MGQTDGLKTFLCQKSCFIPTLLVLDCPKMHKTKIYPLAPPTHTSYVHVGQFALRLPFLFFRISFQKPLSCLIMVSMVVCHLNTGVVCRSNSLNGLVYFWSSIHGVFYPHVAVGYWATKWNTFNLLCSVLCLSLNEHYLHFWQDCCSLPLASW